MKLDELKTSIRNHVHILYQEDANKLADAVWDEIQKYLSALPADMYKKSTVFEHDDGTCIQNEYINKLINSSENVQELADKVIGDNPVKRIAEMRDVLREFLDVIMVTYGEHGLKPVFRTDAITIGQLLEKASALIYEP